MKQLLSKIIGIIVKSLTCDPFPILLNPKKRKNNEENKKERRVEG